MCIKTVTKAYKIIGIPKPDGKTDNGGRWYPSDDERQSCCADIRSPSRAFPGSYYKHCCSMIHLKHRLEFNPTENERIACDMTLDTAALFIDHRNNLVRTTALIFLKGGV